MKGSQLFRTMYIADWCHFFFFFFFFVSQIHFCFVCLLNWSFHEKTHLGPDGTRLKQNIQARLKILLKHAGPMVYGNITERNRFIDKRWMKRRPRIFPTNQVEKFYCQPLGPKKYCLLITLLSNLVDEMYFCANIHRTLKQKLLFP